MTTGKIASAEPDQFFALTRFADRVIKLAVIGCVALLAFFVHSYGWDPTKYLINPISSALYYVIAATAVALLLSLRLPAAYRVSVSIGLLSLAGGIYLIESIVNSPPDLVQIAARTAQGGTRVDRRDRLEVVEELERSGTRVVLNVNAQNLLQETSDGTLRSRFRTNGVEILPLAGVSNTLTVFCNESGEYVIYESDEHGFENPRGIWDSPQVDIAAVGDSFTQGTCVSADDNILGVIRRQYRNTLNLGMVNNGPLAELATLKEYLPGLRPRIVLWIYFEGNDLEDLIRERRTPVLTSYLEPTFTQKLRSRQHQIDDWINAFIAEYRTAAATPEGLTLHTFLENAKRIARLEYLRARTGLSRPGSHGYREDSEMATHLRLFREILRQANGVVKTWDGVLHFVYLPEWLRYAYPSTASAHRDDVLTIVRDLGIPVIDIHRTFQSSPEPIDLFPFRGPGHYNPQGYRLVAEEVLRSISGSGSGGTQAVHR
jgi:hypothetical protein